MQVSIRQIAGLIGEPGVSAQIVADAFAAAGINADDASACVTAAGIATARVHAAECESAVDGATCAAATEAACNAAWGISTYPDDAARHASEAAGAAVCAFDYLVHGRMYDARDEIATMIEECAAAAAEEATATIDRMPRTEDFAADFQALDLARAAARETVFARAASICAEIQ